MTTLDLYLDCENNHMAVDQIFQQLVRVDGDGDPCLYVCGDGGDSITILEEIRDILLDIETNTDDLETIAQNQLSELQDININTDGLEALLNAGNVDLAAILLELQGQTAQNNSIITILSNITNSIQDADNNNVAELQAIQTQLVSVISDLTAIEANTAPLEASLTAIEAAINANSALELAELTQIVTNTLNTVTELQTANVQLALINGQFSGTPTIGRVDISANAAYVIPAGTYFSIELYIIDGTVSDGVIPHEEGKHIETAPIKGATHPGVTFDATGATAYVKLMSN